MLLEKNKILSNIMGQNGENLSQMSIDKLSETVEKAIVYSNLQTRSREKFRNNLVSASKKDTPNNRNKLLDIYEAVKEINATPGRKASFKKVVEVREKRLAQAVIPLREQPKKEKKYYLIDVLLFRLETPSDKGGKFKRVRKYDKTFIQYNSAFQLSVKIKGHFLDKHLNQFIYQPKKPNAFKKGITILKTNEKFKESGWLETYLHAFHILSATRTDRDTYHQYDAVEENLQDTQKISICHQYIDTKLNLECKTFKEALENKNYVEKECCINTLYDYYKDTLLNPNKKQKSYLITRADVLESMGKTEENIKDGIKLPELKLFFEKYKLQLRVINEFNKVIYNYNPEIRNPHHKPMYCMVKGNHIYTLNCEIKALEQKQDYEPEILVYASDDYISYEDAEPIQCRMIAKIDDILEIIKEIGEPEEKTVINLIHINDDLVELLYELIDAGYMPAIKYECGRLSRMSLKFNKIIFFIKTQQLITSSIDGLVCVSSEAVYNNMDKAMVAFKKQVFVKEYKSHLTEQDIKLLNEYRTVANIGLFKNVISSDKKAALKKEIEQCTTFIAADSILIDKPITESEQNEWIESYKKIAGENARPQRLTRDVEQLKKSIEYMKNKINKLQLELSYQTCEELIEIDVSKAYTSAFVGISEVPVFNEFDNFKIYRNEDILDFNLYIIKSNELNLFCNKTYNLCYGKFLSSLSNYDILGFKRPSFIKKVNYKDIVEELFNTDVSSIPQEDEKIKKLIANVNYGMLEKSKNTAVKSYIFETLDEVKTFQEQYGGTVNIIKKYTSEESLRDDDFGGTIIDFNHIQVGKEYYVLSVQNTASLKNGYRYIKELLLQEFNFKLNNDYNTLISNGVEVFSVKTDAFTIRKADVDKAKQLVKFSKEFGGWRVSGTDYKLPPNDFTMTINSEVVIIEPKAERVNIKNEWDTKEICQVFEDKARVMVRAEYAGCGKSYAASYMEQLGHKVLFVCPTNKLAINNKGITINKLFGFGMTSDIKLSKFDDSDYDVIVFDEIYFYSVGMLQKIKHYCESNSSKIIIATGDMNQLEPIECVGNNVDVAYLDSCINMIFPYEVYLEENKRLKNDSDKTTLKQLKKDIFNNDMSILDTINKYFETTDKITTESNIAYTNKKCSYVANQVRKNLNKQSDYEIGEILVVKKRLQMKAIVFNVNYEYEVIKCNDKSICIRDNNNQEEYNVLRCLIDKHFIFNYCGTCHSLQGSSIDKEITIFEWDFKYVSRNWLYTAITRATHLKNVKFSKSDLTDKTEEEQLEKYFKHKVEGYVKQDKKAGRTLSHNYVDVNWLMKCIGKRCSRCHFGFSYDVENGFVSSNITAQRLDNTLDHNVDNIIPYCVYCNCSQAHR